MTGKFELYRFQVGDVLTLRKPHPCGNAEFVVERVGMDIAIKCSKCGHMLIIPRRKLEKAIKNAVHRTSCDII